MRIFRSRLTHLISLGCILLSGAPLAALRAQSIAVNAGSATVSNVTPGTKLTVPIVVDLTNAGALNIASLASGITWGTARLTFDSIKVANGWTFSANTASAGSGSVSFTASNGTSLPATATVVNAFFTATAGTGGTRVVLAPTAAANQAAQSVLLSMRPRALDVCVANFAKWGDVNDDGSVDIIDAQQVARFSVGLSVTNPTALAQRGDVTADGAVDIIDAQQLARFTVSLSSSPRVNTDFASFPTITAVAVAPSTTQTLAVGTSVQLTGTPTAGATDLTGCSALTWETSDASVASVNAAGYVTALAPGSATITVRSAANTSLTASVNIVSLGGAAQVVINTQPGGAVSGANFTQQPVVSLRDAGNNVVTSATSAVTATLTSGTGTLVGTATVNAVAGVATFTNLRIDATGAKQLTFSTSGLTSAVSNSFTVGGALATTQSVAATTGTQNAVIPTFTPVTASGGTTPYAFALSGGALPSGMSFSTTTGAVSGTPTTTLATTTFTVTVTDAASVVSSKTFQLSVNSALVTTQAVAAKTGTVNTAIPTFTPVTASGGTVPYVFALTGGSLPAGMSFSTTNGQVSGTPSSTLAATTFTVTVTDNAGATSSKTFQLTVNSALTTTQAVASVAGTNGTAIPAFTPVTAGGGTTPYAFALSGGTLPTGMSFNTTTGQVSGTPTATLAATTFTVTVTDAATATSSKTFQLTVNSALTTTQAVAATSGTMNTSIPSFTPVTASGGTAPLVFALSGGALPAGMSFNTGTGLLSGTPTATLATTTFTVTVTDAATATSSKTFQLTVNGALTTTQAVATRTGTVNTAMAAFTPVTASGGTAPYGFALSGGALPTGLSFSTTTGQVSGTPTSTLATTTFTVTVTDAASATSSKTFNLTVNAALTTTQAIPVAAGTLNTALTPFTPVTTTGGSAPLAFALSGGTLPAGVSFSTTTGQVSGTPTATLATTTFTVTVTDAASAVSSKTFQFTVNGAFSTTQAVATKTGTINTPIASFTPVTASGGTTPYAFALSGGALPSGMSFSTTTGAVSGTPTATLAATTFTVAVTDAASAVSSKSFQLTVNSALVATQSVPAATGTVGAAFTFAPVSASGGTTPYAFALSGGTLPTGVTFNTSTGQLSGTPSTPLATTTFTVTITDAAGAVAAQTFQLTVNAALTTTQAVATKIGTVNTAIASFTPVTASGGTAPYGFALSGGALPAGMSFSTTTGAISGTPTTTLATTTFTVTVTDAAAASSAKTFQLTVNSALATTQAIASRAGTINTALTPFTPVTASGGTTPYTFAVSGSAVPGVSFSSTTGQVSGTPTATLATTTFTVTVTDAAGATSSKNFDLTINAALTTTQAVASTVGTAGTLIPTFTPVTAANGTAPYTFALSGAALPSGMSFSTSTGAVSGTPAAALAVTTYTVTATDAAGATSSKTFTLTVNTGLSTVQAVPAKVGTVGAALSYTPVTASGGTAPYTIALSGGALPTGVTFNTTNGLVSGTPSTTLATTTFTVTVTDAATASSSKTFQLTVNGALTTTQAVASTTGTAGTLVPTFTPVTASGGTTPYTFALSGGTLPTGMTFNTTTGAVSGTPSTSLATTTFTVTATDAASATSSKTFQLTVNGALSTTQSVASKTGTAGAAIASFVPVTANGGSAPYTYALAGGTLPTGMSFNTSTGAVSGTPSTTLATTTFTVTVTDAAAATSSKTFALTVNAALTTTQVVASKSGTAGTLIPSFTPVTAANGTAPYTFALSGGSLPTGMTFTTASGLVSGTPSTTLAATTFTVTATDAAGATSAKTFQLTVNAALTTTQAVTSVTGTSGAAIASFTPVTAGGGTTPYTFALSGGSLPTGVSFNTTTGAVSGTPSTTLPTTTFTVTVTDAASATSSKTFQLKVNSALTTTQAVASRTVNSGAAISPFTPVTAANGTTPYTFALSGGTLPTGLSFDTSTGQVSGTPTATLATTTFTVTVTDAAAATSSKTFQLTVNAGLTTTQAVPSTTGDNGRAITTFTPVTASGGTTPYTFALSGGALPTGMSFSTTTGAVSGTPTSNLATTTFTVTVTDNVAATSAKTFQLTVNPALATTQAVPATSGTVNIAIPSFTPVTASGGTTPYAFALTGGTLPAGMSFSTTTGQVSGTPTSALATTTFTVTVTDNIGATSAKTFQLTVNGPLSASQSVASATGAVNTALTPFIPVVAGGGTAPYAYAISGASLPAGVSFSTTTGQVSGTPTATQAATTYTVTVTDNTSATASATFDLAVNGVTVNVNATATATTNGSADLVIPINVDMSKAAGQDMASIQLTINWDPSRFTFKSDADGNWVDGIDNTSPATVQTNASSGQLSITGFVIQGTTASFTLRTLTLTALGTASTVSSPVTATISAAANTNADPLAIVRRNLTVTINP
ncbi:MAG TPA: dockerin type I repeat-containing protein [Gemmatimonadaceae bacterium]|nr:dockerin type I repeat-containing protein [Gemmatimonadaceae bacterium]